jgi:hypothetical protein
VVGVALLAGVAVVVADIAGVVDAVVSGFGVAAAGAGLPVMAPAIFATASPKDSAVFPTLSLTATTDEATSFLTSAAAGVGVTAFASGGPLAAEVEAVVFGFAGVGTVVVEASTGFTAAAGAAAASGFAADATGAAAGFGVVAVAASLGLLAVPGLAGDFLTGVPSAFSRFLYVCVFPFLVMVKTSYFTGSPVILSLTVTILTFSFWPALVVLAVLGTGTTVTVGAAAFLASALAKVEGACAGGTTLTTVAIAEY